MLNYATNLPNHVIARQKAYQASHQPIWYRPPRSKIYMNSFKVFFAVGMVANVYSVYSLIRGKAA